ncbi:unnamed protein product [Pleuronectes platessa]|uniref:Uncharacterized protein n=1 Tax=Pleuronectes platessa TaxID=8262 RepID=A0A9N7Z2R5_PLEPL|nr:unnamed protein product [Pleuronectes platessa]
MPPCLRTTWLLKSGLLAVKTNHRCEQSTSAYEPIRSEPTQPGRDHMTRCRMCGDVPASIMSSLLFIVCTNVGPRSGSELAPAPLGLGLVKQQHPACVDPPNKFWPQ